MTSSNMKPLHTWCRYAFVGWLTTVAVGCSQMFQGDEMVHHVNGTWTGKLAMVRVYDRNKNAHDAMALTEWTGPKLDLSRLPHSMTLADLPLLVQDQECRLIAPSGIPLGSKVVVRGRLLVFSAHLKDSGHDVGRHVENGGVFPELLINVQTMRVRKPGREL